MIVGPFAIPWKRRLAQYARDNDLAIPGGFNAATPRWGKHAQALAQAAKTRAGQPNADGRLDKFLRELLTQRTIGEKAVALAESCAADPGWKETSRNRGPKIDAMKLELNGYVDSAPWCADFWTWCAWKSGWRLPTMGELNHRYCPSILDAARHNQHGLVVVPKVRRGDGVLFDWDGDGNPDHIGRVTRTIGPLASFVVVPSVDGNTGGNPADQSGLGAGDAVHKRTRPKSTALAFIREYNEPGLFGIDVSNNNGRVDWRGVAKNERPVRWAYAKATEGVSFKDAYWPENLKGARKAGVPIGAYLFSRARGTQAGVAEVRKFLKHAPDWDLRPVIDWEHVGEADMTTEAERSKLRQTLEAMVGEFIRATGETPIIYSRTNILEPMRFGKSSVVVDCPLWLASYPTVPKPPKPWSAWVAHQFSETGRVRGVSGRCDENVAVNVSVLKKERRA